MANIVQCLTLTLVDAGPSLSAWLFIHLVIPSFRMVYNIFLLILHIRLSLPYPTTRGLSTINSIRIHILHCVHEGKCTTTRDVIWDSFAFHGVHEEKCTTTHDVLWDFFAFHRVHEGKCITMHDVVWDSFVSIVRDIEFHVLWEQTDVLLISSLKISWQIDIWIFTVTGRQLPSSLFQHDIDTWSGKGRQRSCLWSLVGDVQRWQWKFAVSCYTNFGVEVLLKLLENGWQSEQQHHTIPTTKF